MNDKRSRPFDVIVFGATGFTGKLVVEHLLATYGIDQQLRWGIAGRDYQKLEAVRSDLHASGARGSLGTLPLLFGDATDERSLRELVAQTRVVCSTVGPYAKYGSKLVAACVELGTDYCDLAGEAQWIRQMIDQHHEAAAQSGARITHCCGFDSIPSDLGVWFLQCHAQATTGTPCTRVALRVEGMSGGTSGGTIASVFSTLAAARENPEVRALLSDPYALNPSGERSGPDKTESLRSTFDPDLGAWVSPFIMAGINTRVVRRSNALLGYPWGKDFRYEEAMLSGGGAPGWLKAQASSLAWMAFVAGALVAPRALQRLLPQPGHGPDQARRNEGSFSLLLSGHTPKGTQLRARVTGERDPGYGTTSRMLGEAAVCLATDVAPDLSGGILTPTAAMAQHLLPRLTQKAGLRFVVVS